MKNHESKKWNSRVTACEKHSRYKWLIRPLIHRNAIASLDWIGKSAPVPLPLLQWKGENVENP